MRIPTSVRPLRRPVALVVAAALLWSSSGETAGSGRPDLHAGEAPASVTLAAAGSFVDVPPDHRFHDAISWAAAEGITLGYPDGTFRPGEDVTRQAMVAFLHRLAGEPISADSPEFSDVPADHLFHDAIAWAAAEGITLGYPDGTFRPDDLVSRQGSVAFLHRFGGEPASAHPAGFLDVPPEHLFHDAIAWAAEQGVTTGYPDGYFRPGETVTRQAAAAFLHREETEADTRPAIADLIDTSDRAAVAAAFEERTAVINTPSGWTGSHEDCDAGEQSDASKSAVLQMVNYYRAMAGLPPVRVTTAWDRELQEAALVVSTGGWITHFPEPTRPCYTELGAEGAATSNLSGGGSPATAVWIFMVDSGEHNRAVGHRRWLLWPQAGLVGTGATNRVVSLRVRSTSTAARPAGPEWVAWPPEGYVAWPDMPLDMLQGHFHWSLSSNADPDADFSSATVTMTMDDEPLTVTTYAPEPMLDNTLVWNVQRVDDKLFDRNRDAEFTVRIDGIEMSNGRTLSHTYRVRAFTPEGW